jgi:hypothetical protein
MRSQRFARFLVAGATGAPEAYSLR